MNSRHLRLWAPVAGWCAGIYWFSGLPDLRSGLEQDFLLRKLAHLAEYGALWALTRRALAGSLGWGEGRSGLGALVFAALYGASDEWHQSFVPGRNGSPADVAVDALGAALAWGVRVRTGRREPPRTSR